MPVKVFFCYAHEDESLLLKLKVHLGPLQREGIIDEIWYDRDISPGAEWGKEIDKHLNTAQIILLLVSPDFMNSDYCYTQQPAHTTACTQKILNVRWIAREGLKASYFGKWKPENLPTAMEIDSCTISGECATILHEPLRKPQQTFSV